VSHLLVTGNTKTLRTILALAQTHEISLGIIPNTKQKELIRTLSLPSKVKERIAVALKPQEKKIDLLYCNETIVLQEVVIGDAPPLDTFEAVLEGKGLFDRLKLFWKTLRKVKSLKHRKIKILDAKENVMDISAVGLVAVSYKNETFASKLLSSKLSATDGKLVLAILSPTSMLQYMTYVFQSIVSHKTSKNLPKSIGYISSASLQIETDMPLRVLVDDEEIESKTLVLAVKREALALSVGEAFWEKQSVGQNGKDSVKIDHLPSDKESSEYLAKAIPLFSHASKEQYATLFSNLREEGRLNSVYITLLILSTMIATFGLFIDSSSVIIGAMLLAPLMQPIVSFSMGALRQDSTLEINSAKSIFWGVFSVLLTSALIALFIPIEHLTSEMKGRLSPTILDLFVAIVSGVAAAYVKNNEKIMSSLAGVAIAVALVPPIAVAGIGLGWGDLHMFMMAFLLFITNLVGIVFAASLTFVFLGFSPLKVAKRGVAIWLVMVTLISIPLYGAFKQMETEAKVQSRLSNVTFQLAEHDVTLVNVQLIHGLKKDEIHCDVEATGKLNKDEMLRLKEAILGTVKKDTDILVTFKYKL
ncbi:MAG: TIGR00341 family protein, partial [Sulfurovum sp.]|nr:TIGR00341 family protein [Sulfurovum sp.]